MMHAMSEKYMTHPKDWDGKIPEGEDLSKQEPDYVEES